MDHVALDHQVVVDELCGIRVVGVNAANLGCAMRLSPIMVDKIFEVVRDVHKQGVTILLVEQNASRALEIADRGYVMESGVISMSGDAREMLNNRR